MSTYHRIMPVLLSQEIDHTVRGNIVHRIYACPCGKGTIEEDQDYSAGHRDGYAFLKCEFCDKKYYIDFGQSATKWSIIEKATSVITNMELLKRINERDR